MVLFLVDFVCSDVCCQWLKVSISVNAGIGSKVMSLNGRGVRFAVLVPLGLL